jgi:dihydroorotate dehydrogenase (NAD+) catalytic subunit
VAGVKPTLAVDLAGVSLPTPVMVASGCFGLGKEIADLADVRGFGGVVTGTLTLGPTKGLPTPRMTETASGLLTAIGVQNPGVETFVKRQLPVLAEFGIPVFVSVGGTTAEEFVRVTAMLQGAGGVTALEANLACPDLERGGDPFGAKLKPAIEVVGGMARVSMLPVFAKLSAGGVDLLEVAEGCVRAGALGLTLINSLPGMAIDPRTLRARLAGGIGGLSGPAILPIAVQTVFRVARAFPEVPILGVGGISTADDAVELILAGAWAVQVGTAMFRDPSTPLDVARGILAYLGEKGLLSPAEIRGRVRTREPLPIPPGS